MNYKSIFVEDLASLLALTTTALALNALFQTHICRKNSSSRKVPFH
jgi:hypothetical protein